MSNEIEIPNDVTLMIRMKHATRNGKSGRDIATLFIDNEEQGAKLDLCSNANNIRVALAMLGHVGEQLQANLRDAEGTVRI